MSTFRDIRKNILTADIDLALVAAGTQVFSAPTSNKRGRLRGSLTNVMHGQLVVVDPVTGLAVDDSNIGGYANVDKLIIGVGIDSSGNKGVANLLRRVAGEEMFGCTIDYIRNKAPRCGTPHIQDIFFKCVQPCTEYALKVSINDSQTRSEEPWNRDPHVTATFKTSCGDCDSCAVTANCSDLACGLIDDYYNQLQEIDWDWKQGIGNDQPVELVRLFGGVQSTKIYCFTLAGDTCEDCFHITDDITEFTFKGVTTQLTNSVDPTDNTRTLVSQLQGIADQINAVLSVQGEGCAVLQQGVGKCCPIELHVNSCDANFEISDGTTAFTPCTHEDPAATVGIDITCGDCNDPVAASGTVTLASVLAGDTVTVNGLVYTAVAGAKSDNTEFSIDGTDTADATDLADSIANDNRVGTLFDVTATSNAAVVTITQTVAGSAGNATTLASSDGGRLAVSGATLSGGSGENSAEIWNCGVRAIVHPVEVPCGAYGPNPLAAYFGRSVKMELVGDGWANCSTYTREYREMELPENFGAHIQIQEYISDNGGAARGHNDWNTYRGPKYAADKTGRIGSEIARCELTYCTWDIGHHIPHTQYGIDASVNPVAVVSTIAIPDTFTTAVASWEAFLTAYMTELGPKCPRVTGVTCAQAYGPNGYRS